MIDPRRTVRCALELAAHDTPSLRTSEIVKSGPRWPARWCRRSDSVTTQVFLPQSVSADRSEQPVIQLLRDWSCRNSHRGSDRCEIDLSVLRVSHAVLCGQPAGVRFGQNSTLRFQPLLGQKMGFVIAAL
jgi:hypothetical protein